MQVLVRTLNILTLLSMHPGGRTLREISDALAWIRGRGWSTVLESAW